jgi:histidine triad (HIT) family protein
MDDCIFCRIARGEMDAAIVYSDDEFVAFDDIMPQAPVHTLVIPRQHFATMDDGVPEALFGKLCGVVRKVAELKGIVESGYRVVVNNGPEAGQTVWHLHVHVLGGARFGHGMVNLVTSLRDGD